MLLSAVAETRLSEAIDYSGASLLVVVVLGDIIIFTFKSFSGSVFALTLDYADAGGGFDGGSEDFLCYTGSLVGG